MEEPTILRMLLKSAVDIGRRVQLFFYYLACVRYGFSSSRGPMLAQWGAGIAVPDGNERSTLRTSYRHLFDYIQINFTIQ